VKKEKLNKTKLNLSICPKLKELVRKKKGSKTYSELFSELAAYFLKNSYMKSK